MYQSEVIVDVSQQSIESTQLLNIECLIEIIQRPSCFVLNIPDDHQNKIRNEPFRLACGELLEVGDMFTKIHSSGSAGNPPITLTEGWVQRYLGLIELKDSFCNGLAACWEKRDFVLFDAIKLDDPNEGFLSHSKRSKKTGNKSTNDGFFIAYLRFGGNQDKLFHLRSISSSGVCGCTGIDRYIPD